MEKIYFHPRPMGKSWTYRRMIGETFAWRVRQILGSIGRIKPDYIWIDEMAENIKLDDITRRRILFGEWHA